MVQVAQFLPAGWKELGSPKETGSQIFCSVLSFQIEPYIVFPDCQMVVLFVSHSRALARLIAENIHHLVPQHIKLK